RELPVRRPGHRLPGFRPAPVALSALLVTVCGGTVLSGVAVADHRYRVAGSAHRADPPRRFVAPRAVRGGAHPGRGRVPDGGRAVDAGGTAVGVLLAAHPRLGTGRRWPGGPVDSAMAPAAFAPGDGRGLGRPGVDRADLHAAGPEHPVPRNRGATAGAGYRAGDRRWLRHRSDGRRSPAVQAADAVDRPDFLLVVPVALAGAGADAVAAG